MFSCAAEDEGAGRSGAGKGRDEKLEVGVSVIWVVEVIGGNIQFLHRAAVGVYGRDEWGKCLDSPPPPTAQLSKHAE